MGTLLQNITKLFADGTGVEGADIQVNRDNIKYYMEIKSGPDTINKGMLQNYDRQLRGAVRRNGNAFGAIGLCYGTRGSLGPIISRYLPDDTSLHLFVGRELWSLLGDYEANVYDVYETIGNICDSYRDDDGQTLVDIINDKINEITAEFVELYGDGGREMWDEILERNV